MPLVLASSHLSDDEFLAAFHDCRLKNSEFRHADHLRLAWLHLHREPLEMALANVRAGIQKFAREHNATGLYHETVTTAWVRLLSTHHEAEFGEFLSANEHLLNKELLHRFWTPELLASDKARTQWVPPDRCALSCLPALIPGNYRLRPCSGVPVDITSSPHPGKSSTTT